MACSVVQLCFRLQSVRAGEVASTAVGFALGTRRAVVSQMPVQRPLSGEELLGRWVWGIIAPAATAGKVVDVHAWQAQPLLGVPSAPARHPCHAPAMLVAPTLVPLEMSGRPTSVFAVTEVARQLAVCKPLRVLLRHVALQVGRCTGKHNTVCVPMQAMHTHHCDNWLLHTASASGSQCGSRCQRTAAWLRADVCAVHELAVAVAFAVAASVMQ